MKKLNENLMQYAIHNIGMANLTSEYIPLVQPDENGFTDIFYKVAHGFDISDYSEEELDIFSDNELHLIHIAAYFNNIQALKHLIDLGIDINTSDRFSTQAIHFAAQSGSLEAVELLLQNEADVNATATYEANHRPLHIAAYNGYTKIVALLLRYGADVNVTDDDGCQPLHDATQYGDIEMVELLINHGADVNVSGQEGYHPLHYAAGREYVKMVELLIQNEANIHATNDYGCQAIHFAAQSGSLEVVELLIQNGADVNATDDEGKQPIHLAAGRKRPKMVELLIQNKANIHATDNEGRQPIHFAVGREGAKTVELLIQKGANIHATDNKGRQPLHLAAQPIYYAADSKEHIEIVKLLIQKGANINATDDEGKQPIHLAAKMGCTEMVELLIQKYKKSNKKIEFETILTKDNFSFFKVLLDVKSRSSADLSYFHYRLYASFAKLYKELDDNQKATLENQFKNDPKFVFFCNALIISKESSVIDIESAVSIMFNLQEKGKTFLETRNIIDKSGELYTKLSDTIKDENKFVNYESFELTTRLVTTAKEINIAGLNGDILNKIFFHITENNGINYSEALNITFDNVTAEEVIGPDETPISSEPKRQKQI